MNKPDREKIGRMLDNAWRVSCEVDICDATGVHGNVVRPVSLLCVAVQDLVLAIREMVKPEELK